MQHASGGPVMETSTSLPGFLGAGGFGAILGWYVYYVNRHRTSDVRLNDLVTLVGVLGGGAITSLFGRGTALFGAYGIGLFLGFFGYFVVLLLMVRWSKNFDVDWFLDGRRRRVDEFEVIPDGTASGRFTALGPDGRPNINA